MLHVLAPLPGPGGVELARARLLKGRSRYNNIDARRTFPYIPGLGNATWVGACVLTGDTNHNLNNLI